MNSLSSRYAALSPLEKVGLWFGLLVFFPGCLIAIVVLPNQGMTQVTESPQIQACRDRVRKQVIRYFAAKMDATTTGLPNEQYQKLPLQTRQEIGYMSAEIIKQEQAFLVSYPDKCRTDPNFQFY